MFTCGAAEMPHLAGQGANNGLGVDQAGLAQVVEATLAEDGGAGLEPGELVRGGQLGGDAAQSA